MSAFDLVTLASTIVAVGAVLLRERPLAGRERYLAWGALAFAAAHLLLARRQSFYPLYGVALAVAFTMRPATYGSRRMRRAMGVAALLALLVSAGLAWAFPVTRRPPPDGPLAVGTRLIVVTDSTRGESFTADTTDRRRLLVRLWYPADSSSAPFLPVMDATQGRYLARLLGLPAFAFNHLARVPSWARVDAPLSTREREWPVVLFSHGFGMGTESQNSVQMEALASHGYVVLSIAHPFEAAAVVYPDGEVVPAAPMPTLDSTVARRLQPLVSQLATQSDTARLVAILDSMRAALPLDESLARWTDDTRVVADLLSAWRNGNGNPPDGFAGRLRADRLGIAGMSFGGAVAAEFCRLDTRCAGGVNFDGMLHGAAATQPMTRPFLFASSALNRYVLEPAFQRAQAPVLSLSVAGSTHLDYTDFGYISPLLARAGMLGGIPAARMHGIMNAALVTTMDAWLRDRPLDPSAITRYPEAALRTRTPTPVTPTASLPATPR